MSDFFLSSRFLNELHVQVVPGRTGKIIYQVTQPLDYVTSLVPDSPLITVPAGFPSDGASVPRIFWGIFPPSGQYTMAAVLHDFLCDYKVFDSRTSHRIFAEALKDLGVPRRVRYPMASAVRIGGPRWKDAGIGPEQALELFEKLG